MIKNQEEDEFVAVRVQDPRVQNEGFWNSYVDYKIFLHTNSKAFTAKTSCVRRRYSEFVWLKKNLQKNSGLVPVPDLPGKSLFSFSNEEFLEKRRKGLQFFLDKVLHMTVCLSDSQLHLFLQTQLPIGHIVDCVQGHTPYTVTDAILTYASSNRGWVQAQEEDDLIQEPSLTPVSYESMESPAPHLPTVPGVNAPESVRLATSESEEHIAEIREETMELQLNESETPAVRSHREERGGDAAGDRASPEDITISGDTQGEAAAGGQHQEEDEEDEEAATTQLLGCRLLMPVEVHSPMDTDADGVAETEGSPGNEGTAPCLQTVPVPATHKEAGQEGRPEESFPQVTSREQVEVNGHQEQSPDAKSNDSIEQDPNQEQTRVMEHYSEISEEAEPSVAIASAVVDDGEGRSETPVKHAERIGDVKREDGWKESGGLDCDGDSHSVPSTDSQSESDIESIQEESEMYMQTALPEDEGLHPDPTEVSGKELLGFETNGEAGLDLSVAEVTEAEESNSYIHHTTDSAEDLRRDLLEPQSNGNPTTGATLDEVTTDPEQKHCYIETVQSVKPTAPVRDNAESTHKETLAEVNETCEEINSSIDTVPEEECEEQGEQEEEEESFSTDEKKVEVSVKQTAQVQNNPESTHKENVAEGKEIQEDIDHYIETVLKEQEEEPEEDGSFSTDNKEVEESVKETARVQNNPESALEENVAKGKETQEEIDSYIETVFEEQEEDGSFSTDDKEVEESVKETARVQNNPESALEEDVAEGKETLEKMEPYIETVFEEQEEDESFVTDDKEVEESVKETARVQNNPESALEENVAEGKETQEEIEPYIETVFEEQEEDESFVTDDKEVEESVKETARVQNNPESALKESVAEGKETLEKMEPYIETVIEKLEGEEQKEEQEEERAEEQEEKEKKILITNSGHVSNYVTLQVQANGDPACDSSTEEETVEIQVPVPASEEDAPGLFTLTNGGPHSIPELEPSRTAEGEDEHKG